MRERIPVTVIVPTKNEQANIGRCLAALDGFDEVIVVDSGSTDATCEIARQAGARVVDFQWNGRFPKKRNWCLRNLDLKNEWVLFLDADEVVTTEFREELRCVLRASACNGYWVNYQNWFMSRLLKHGDAMRKLSLFRVGAGEYERIDEDSWSHLDMEVHEHPIIEGDVGRIAAPVVHHDYRGMEPYLARHNAYSTWEARRYMKLREQAHPHLTLRQRVKYRLMGSWLLGPLYFLGAYVGKLGFLDERAGLGLALFKAFYFWQTKCKIEELKRPEVGLRYAKSLQSHKST